MNALRLTLYSVILYAATLALGIAVTWGHILDPAAASIISPSSLGWSDALFFVLVMIGFTVVMVRFVRATRASLMLISTIALVVGAQFTFATWFPWPWSLIGGIVALVLAAYRPTVWSHDVAMMLCLAGIASVLGLSLNPLIASVLLIVLSLYDVFSVYRSKHMVSLAGNMLSSGIILGFLIPARYKTFFAQRNRALGERSVMLLGSGDIGLPLMLVTATASQSLQAAAIVAVGALMGVVLMHVLFLRQRTPHPMAALPPIAVPAVIGYLVAALTVL